MTETQYRAKLTRKLRVLLPGCFILQNAPQLNQGIPDLLILYCNRWAMLEIKLAGDSHIQPNQEYYVDFFNEMSFASFINPENEEDVLSDLQRALRFVRKARIPQPK